MAKSSVKNAPSKKLGVPSGGNRGNNPPKPSTTSGNSTKPKTK